VRWGETESTWYAANSRTIVQSPGSIEYGAFGGKGYGMANRSTRGKPAPVPFIHSFIRQWIYSPLLGPGLFFSFVIFFTQTVGLLGREISSSQDRCLHRTTQTQNKRIHRHPCLWVGFEPTIPSFERAKTVHARDRGATVTDSSAILSTTNSTWPDLGSKLGRHSGKPANIRLSYRTDFEVIILGLRTRDPKLFIFEKFGYQAGTQWPTHELNSSSLLRRWISLQSLHGTDNVAWQATCVPLPVSTLWGHPVRLQYLHDAPLRNLVTETFLSLTAYYANSTVLQKAEWVPEAPCVGNDKHSMAWSCLTPTAILPGEFIYSLFNDVVNSTPR
jgi:hypothetical protein